MLTLNTEHGEGQAYVAVPASGRGPGVLVLHAWWGLNDFFKALCDRLAEAGFVALAPDLNNGQIAMTVDEAEALMKGRDWARTQAMAEAGLAQLLAHPAVEGTRVGVIGFSMGAAWAIFLSGQRPEAIAAVVDFYGTGETDFAQARAAYLCHFADPDDWEPLEGVRAMEAAMQAAGREVTLHLYPGAGHWFFEGDRPDAYRPAEAEQAWTRTVEFLRRYL
jgi:carboxymethylenebutenolidase